MAGQKARCATCPDANHYAAVNVVGQITMNTGVHFMSCTCRDGACLHEAGMHVKRFILNLYVGFAFKWPGFHILWFVGLLPGSHQC